MDYAIYANDGRIRNGVPARNLSKKEWETIPEETRDELIAEGVYKIGESNKQGKKVSVDVSEGKDG